jgi:DNA-binding IclR family transcriptional regulator
MTERASPPTERVVRVLNLIASHPRESFTLTEISKQLGIATATCLGIVTELTRFGYLARESGSKAYRLGPTVLMLGRAARNAYASLDLVRPKLQELTDQFGFSCTASAVVDNDIVVLERTGLPDQMDQSLQVGQRYPYAPPSGMVFAVWLSDDAIDQWLSTHDPVSIDREYLRALVQSCRKLGYMVERFSDISIGSLMLLAGLTAMDNTPAVLQAYKEIVAIFPERYLLENDIESSPSQSVTMICAPTYTEFGTPDLLLAMLTLSELTREQVHTFGLALRDLGLRASAETGKQVVSTSTA